MVVELDAASEAVSARDSVEVDDASLVVILVVASARAEDDVACVGVVEVDNVENIGRGATPVGVVLEVGNGAGTGGVCFGGATDGVVIGIGAFFGPQRTSSMCPAWICLSRELTGALTLKHSPRTVNCAAWSPAMQDWEHEAPAAKSAGVHRWMGML